MTLHRRVVNIIIYSKIYSAVTITRYLTYLQDDIIKFIITIFLQINLCLRLLPDHNTNILLSFVPTCSAPLQVLINSSNTIRVYFEFTSISTFNNERILFMKFRRRSDAVYENVKNHTYTKFSKR